AGGAALGWTWAGVILAWRTPRSGSATSGSPVSLALDPHRGVGVAQHGDQLARSGDRGVGALGPLARHHGHARPLAGGHELARGFGGGDGDVPDVDGRVGRAQWSADLREQRLGALSG